MCVTPFAPMNCSSVNSQFTEQYRLSVCTFLSTWHVIENHRSVILHRCGYWFAVLSVNDFEQFSCRTSILPQSLVAYAFEIFTGRKHRLIKLFLFVTINSIYSYWKLDSSRTTSLHLLSGRVVPKHVTRTRALERTVVRYFVLKVPFLADT